MSGAERIAAERQRQIDKEGYTAEHDDAHASDDFVRAAVAYLETSGPHRPVPMGWPWYEGEWKPKDRISNLVRAGALIAAEIDRLERARKAESHDATR